MKVLEMFMNRKMTTKNEFKLQKLERPMVVRNIDSTNNSGGAITYQIKVKCILQKLHEKNKNRCNVIWGEQTLYWIYHSCKYTTLK